MAPETKPELRRLQQLSVESLRRVGLSYDAQQLARASTLFDVSQRLHEASTHVIAAESVLIAEGYSPSERIRDCSRALRSLRRELDNEPRDDDRRTA